MPILLYAAAFWFTEVERDSGRGGMAGEEAVEGPAAVVVVAAGIAAVGETDGSMGWVVSND